MPGALSQCNLSRVCTHGRGWILRDDVCVSKPCNALTETVKGKPRETWIYRGRPSNDQTNKDRSTGEFVRSALASASTAQSSAVACVWAGQQHGERVRTGQRIPTYIHVAYVIDNSATDPSRLWVRVPKALKGRSQVHRIHRPRLPVVVLSVVSHHPPSLPSLGHLVVDYEWRSP